MEKMNNEWIKFDANDNTTYPTGGDFSCYILTSDPTLINPDDKYAVYEVIWDDDEKEFYDEYKYHAKVMDDDEYYYWYPFDKKFIIGYQIVPPKPPIPPVPDDEEIKRLLS